ncbi:MAG: peptide ABC transporter substrate-binding protein, partial [Desulfobacterales bacterium]
IVEIGEAEGIFRTPKHPYTQALIGAIPQMDAAAALNVDLLSGEPPSPLYIPIGCAFHPRCPHAMAVCRSDPPPVSRNMGPVQVSCHLYEEDKR